MPTTRELEREIERLRRPNGVDREDLGPLSITKMMSDDPQYEIVWTDTDLGLGRFANGEFYRIPDWAGRDLEDEDDTEADDE